MTDRPERSLAEVIDAARQHVKLTRRGQEHVGPCPFCGGDDRFRILDGATAVIVQCRKCERPFADFMRLLFPDDARRQDGDQIPDRRNWRPGPVKRTDADQDDFAAWIREGEPDAEPPPPEPEPNDYMAELARTLAEVKAAVGPAAEVEALSKWAAWKLPPGATVSPSAFGARTTEAAKPWAASVVVPRAPLEAWTDAGPPPDWQAFAVVNVDADGQPAADWGGRAKRSTGAARELGCGPLVHVVGFDADAKTVHACEGYADAVALFAAYGEPVVTPIGRLNILDADAMLSAFPRARFVLHPDNDDKRQSRRDAEKTKRKLRGRARVQRYPTDYDPCRYWRERLLADQAAHGEPAATEPQARPETRPDERNAADPPETHKKGADGTRGTDGTPIARAEGEASEPTAPKRPEAKRDTSIQFSDDADAEYARLVARAVEAFDLGPPEPLPPEPETEPASGTDRARRGEVAREVRRRPERTVKASEPSADAAGAARFAARFPSMAKLERWNGWTLDRRRRTEAKPTGKRCSHCDGPGDFGTVGVCDRCRGIGDFARPNAPKSMPDTPPTKPTPRIDASSEPASDPNRECWFCWAPPGEACPEWCTPRKRALSRMAA